MNKEKSGGISTLGVLTVAFVVLKLCGVIDWSWWLVLLPTWGGLALGLTLYGVVLLIARKRGRARR